MAPSRPAACPHLLPGGRPVADAQARVDVATTWGLETLPESPGRDADQIVAAVHAGELGGLVVGGVDPDDTADPAPFRAALDAASFVVALELRETDVTRVADVVFPVARSRRQGRHLRDLGGPPALVRRDLRQPAVAARPAACWPGSPRSSAARWASARSPRCAARWRTSARGTATEPRTTPVLDGKPAKAAAKTVTLATWKQLLDNGSMQDGDDNLRATARNAVAKVEPGRPRRLRRHRDASPVTAASGRCRPRSRDLPDGVVWVPANYAGNGVLADLASPGSRVTVKGAHA